tara:strand:+ start:391 stop:558 length:168 start_codon:yes stop_codon:yes gene_type:complete
MSSELERHEAECALRYENFKEQFKTVSDRVSRVEMALYGLYPFMVTLVFTVGFLK